MITNKVFFADLRTSYKKNLSAKINILLDKTGVNTTVHRGDIVAVKLHFGEKGNTAFIRPVFIRDIVEKIRSFQAKPFLTDANTLYRGEREEAVSHVTLALTHGFTYTTVSAPVIIADGLRGTDQIKVRIDGKHFKNVSIASSIVSSDVLVRVAAEDYDHRIVRNILSDRMNQGLNACGIVGGIDHNSRVIADHLHSPGQRDLVKTLCGLVVVYLVSGGL